MEDTQTKLRDALLNMLGFFDTPAMRLALKGRGWTDMHEEACREARKAIGASHEPSQVISTLGGPSLDEAISAIETLKTWQRANGDVARDAAMKIANAEAQRNDLARRVAAMTSEPPPERSIENGFTIEWREREGRWYSYRDSGEFMFSGEPWYLAKRIGEFVDDSSRLRTLLTDLDGWLAHMDGEGYNDRQYRKGDVRAAVAKAREKGVPARPSDATLVLNIASIVSPRGKLVHRDKILDAVKAVVAARDSAEQDASTLKAQRDEANEWRRDMDEIMGATWDQSVRTVVSEGKDVDAINVYTQRISDLLVEVEQAKDVLRYIAHFGEEPEAMKSAMTLHYDMSGWAKRYLEHGDVPDWPGRDSAGAKYPLLRPTREEIVFRLKACDPSLTIDGQDMPGMGWMTIKSNFEADLKRSLAAGSYTVTGDQKFFDVRSDDEWFIAACASRTDAQKVASELNRHLRNLAEAERRRLADKAKLNLVGGIAMNLMTAAGLPWEGRVAILGNFSAWESDAASIEGAWRHAGEEAHAIIREAVAAEERQRWRTGSPPPEVESKVLTYRGNSWPPHFRIGSEGSSGGTRGEYAVTHWMPLPEAPKYESRVTLNVGRRGPV